jgi:hypothetical protein
MAGEGAVFGPFGIVATCSHLEAMRVALLVLSTTSSNRRCHCPVKFHRCETLTEEVMMPVRFVLTVYCLILQHCWSDSATAEDITADDLVRRLEYAAGTSDVVLDFDALFRERPMEQVEALRFHESDTIAIRSAWETVRRSFPNVRLEQPRRVNSGVLGRFLGFVEGRTRCAVPIWWESALSRMTASERDEWVFDDPLIFRDGPGGLRITRDIDVELLGDGYLLRQGGVECTVSHELNQYRRSNLPAHALVAKFVQDKVLVAFCSEVAEGFRLYLLDRSTSKPVWSAKAWAANTSIASTGPRIGIHSVEIVVCGDRVFLFGLDIVRAYIEAFSLKDGTTLLRFSTHL